MLSAVSTALTSVREAEDDAAVGAYWQSLRAKDAAETGRCLAQLMERPIAVEFERLAVCDCAELLVANEQPPSRV